MATHVGQFSIRGPFLKRPSYRGAVLYWDLKRGPSLENYQCEAKPVSGSFRILAVSTEPRSPGGQSGSKAVCFKVVLARCITFSSMTSNYTCNPGYGSELVN